jgi:hypothetical protein
VVKPNASASRRKPARRDRLEKKLLGETEGYRIYSVNAFAVRNLAKKDEEFDNFATGDEFPDLIPEKEVWLSNRSIPSERKYFIADAVARLKALEAGKPEEKAYDAGLEADRKLRQEKSGLPYRAGRPHRRVPKKVYRRLYAVLPDAVEPIEVWLVDANVVRCFYKTDYTEGGHGYVYRWCPKHEIWIEHTIDEDERPLIVAHEYLELRLMRDRGIAYDKAHEICSEIEFHLRKARHRKVFPYLSRRKLTKKDLPKLTLPDFFEYVRERYLSRR